MNENDEFAVVYMVAGLSSRFGGQVKQFARIGKNNETLIELSMNQAIKAGFNKIIFIVGDKTESLFKKKFGCDYNNTPVCYAKQEFDLTKREKPWGTCDALVSAKNLLTKKFVVCNGDDLYGENSFKLLFNSLSNKNGSLATLGFRLGDSIPVKGVVNRGVFLVDENNFVIDLKEIIGIEGLKLSEMGLSKNDLCSMNIFALNKEIVIELEKKLVEFKETHKNNKVIECYLPTELAKLIKENKLKLKLLITPDKWMGVTHPEDEIELRNKINNLG